MDQRHEISVGEKTLLNEITGCVRGAVNSSHHQCVETLGANLLIAARAEDPIVEAIQWENAHENPFYLGVQVTFARSEQRRHRSRVVLHFSGIQNEWWTKTVHFPSISVKRFLILSSNTETQPRSKMKLLQQPAALRLNCMNRIPPAMRCCIPFFSENILFF